MHEIRCIILRNATPVRGLRRWRPVLLLRFQHQFRCQSTLVNDLDAHKAFPDTVDGIPKRQRSPRKADKRLPFVDDLTITIQAGKGGDGCTSFERVGRSARPSGGAGGIGGSIYIQSDGQLKDLSSISPIVKAGKGASGRGSWQVGVRGSDRILRVPFGTIVRQIKSLEDVTVSEEQTFESSEEARERIFIHHPANLGAEYSEIDQRAIKRVQGAVLQQERKQRHSFENRPPLQYDIGPSTRSPILIARGGVGGYGNAVFATNELKMPRFATRGFQGERMKLHLELKCIADIGLIGMPNRGKSSLIQALSNSKSRIADFPFTTLSPHVASVILLEDGNVSTDRGPSAKIDPTQEVFRFTIADTPGLLRDAANNGLGSTFLKHIERSRLLVYVVDLSLPHPELELDLLKQELESHQSGLSARGRLIVANKADLLEAQSAEVDERLARLHAWGADEKVSVVVCSAKENGNISKLAWTLRDLLIVDAKQSLHTNL